MNIESTRTSVSPKCSEKLTNKSRGLVEILWASGLGVDLDPLEVGGLEGLARGAALPGVGCQEGGGAAPAREVQRVAWRC